LTGADVLPDQYERPQGFFVLLGIDEPADADRVFRALAEACGSPKSQRGASDVGRKLSDRRRSVFSVTEK
jgi:hypothetical protein